MQHRPLAVLLLVVTTIVLASGCPVIGPTGGPDVEPDVNQPGVIEPECVLVAAGDVVVDVQQDVQTIYSAPMVDSLGSPIIDDFLVFNFVNYNERFGLAGIGTFPLDAAPNDNRGTCGECLSVFEDQPNPNAEPAKVFFQTEGEITVDPNPRSLRFVGSVRGLELREVTISAETLESTLVPGGECLRFDDFDVDVRFVPADWTCDAELYNGGGDCDCTCGAYDPDCACDPFTQQDCSVPIVDDCAANEVCTLNGCLESCDLFASNGGTNCAPGICIHGGQNSVCSNNLTQVDAAILGADCTGPLEDFATVYCAIADGNAAGMCDSTTGKCAAICDNNARCADDETCIILDTTGGYCQQGPPFEWFNCDGALWNDGLTCDCGCGIADPDCDDDTLPIRSCAIGEICFDGVCE